MDDTVALLRERLAKAEAKVTRAEKSLESAKIEVSDIQTTLRVLEDLAGESKRPEVGDQATRQMLLLQTIPESEVASASPAEMWETYRLIHSDPANLEAFRTAVWRMKDKTFIWKGDKWTVRSADGRYWRDSDVPENEFGSFAKAVANGEWEIDDDPPF